MMERKQNESEIDELIQDWIIVLAAEEAASRLQEAGVAASVVQSAQDLLQDPQLERSFWLLEHSEIGPFHHLGQAFTFSRVEAEVCRPAPCLGQDTEYICRQILGMPDEEFVALLGTGILE
jgi:benzylsuccinate CoA-transferase BbsF subunit